MNERKLHLYKKVDFGIDITFKDVVSVIKNDIVLYRDGKSIKFFPLNHTDDIATIFFSIRDIISRGWKVHTVLNGIEVVKLKKNNHVRRI